MKTEEQTKKYQKIIAKAWADEAFKERLLAKPSEVFSEEGIDVPKDVEIRVVEATSSVRYFVLPPKPGDNTHDILEVGRREAAQDLIEYALISR